MQPPIKMMNVSVPWYAQGQFVLLKGPNEPSPPPPDEYTLFVTLGRYGDQRAFMPQPINKVEIFKLCGDSHFVPESPDDVQLGVALEGRGFAEFRFHRNPEGRLSCIELSGLKQEDPDQALSFGMDLFFALLQTFALAKQLPIIHRGALLVGKQSGNWRAIIRPDYGDVSLRLTDLKVPNPFIRLLGPSYVEGLRSPFPFYSLICFFRIVEFIDKNKNRIVGAQKKYNLACEKVRVLMPDDPVATIAPEYQGKSAISVVKDLEKKYRDYVAHLDADDRYPPLSFPGEERFKVAAMVARSAAHVLIQSYEKDVVQLLNAGMPLSELAELFRAELPKLEPVEIPHGYAPLDQIGATKPLSCFENGSE